MNSYDLSRNWFDWCFENPEKICPNHTALYFFAIEHCNRLGWREKFGFPTEMAKDALGIKSYNTYIKTLNDLVDFGFIKMIERSKNQYSSNIIALSNFNKATDKALDKAISKHKVKQHESIDSINKPLTIKPITINNIEDVPILDFSNPPPESLKIDYDKLKLFFNDNCGNISKVKIMTDERKRSISLLLKKYSKEQFKEVIEKAKISDFLQGNNDRLWKADFDWILNKKNFVKILEGIYDNKINNQKNTTNGKQQQFTGTTKKPARFSIARAEQTLLADAERKRIEMENRYSGS